MHGLVRPGLGLLSLLLAASALAADPSLDAATLARIRREIEAARKASPVPGVSVAIVKEGKVVFAEGFGWADVAQHRRATADTVYDIGSCTKSFTALLATQGQVEGRLSLKDRPTKYLPTFALKDKDASARITLEDMLSHRSGLARTDVAMIAGDFTRDELMQLAAQSEPTAKLGQRWQYQNLMFAFMGSILEKVYGRSYDDLLAERYFRPLDMTHSASSYVRTKAQPLLATGYAGDGRALRLRNIDNVAPAGSISSNVRDMANYLRMLLADGSFDGKTVFAKEAIEETRKPRIEMMPGTGQFYGLGWMLMKEDGVQRVFHGGNIDGFTASLSLEPSQNLGIVVLSNGDGASLPQQVTDLVYDALKPKAPASAAASTDAKIEATDAEMGRYQSKAPPIDLEFSREGKRTFMTQAGQKIPLELVGPKRYTIQKVIYLTFGEPDGKREVKVEQGGMTFHLLPAAPYQAPLSAEALLAKAVEAEGGADAIRRHPRFTVHYRTAIPTSAIEIYGIRYRRDPISYADFMVFYGLNRRFATLLDATDGQAEMVRASFSLPNTKTGPAADEAIALGDLYADLAPSRTYRSLKIVREDKVGDRKVYVLEKTLPSGDKVTDSLDAENGRLLRRIAGHGAGLSRTEYSDFRNVDGLTMPFHSEAFDATGGHSVEDILSVRFDEPVPDWPFRRD